MHRQLLGLGILGLALWSGWPVRAWAYNKSWDQGHAYTLPADGSKGWGHHAKETASKDDTRGTYTSKTCCEWLCKVCPVYANTGRLQKTFVDLRVPGVGPSLTVTRTYQSQDWATSLLGRGWVFNYGRRLTILRTREGEKRVLVRQDTGEMNFFREDPNGGLQLLADYGVTYQLMRNPDGTYVMVYRDGTVEHITADGRLLQVLDRNANGLSFEYNAVGCLSRITNGSGNSLDFQLGPNGKIARVSDNLGRAVQYAYDANGNLMSSRDPMGYVTQYEYDAQDRLVRMVDPRGNAILAVTYDESQPPRVAILKEKGETWGITYEDSNTVKTDSSGNAWTYTFNDLGIIEKVSSPAGQTRQQHHNKVTSTSVDWEEDANGHRSTYTYDSEGHVASKTDPLGNLWQYRTVAGTDHLESQTDPLGVVTRYEYDTRGNLAKAIRDAGGPLQNETAYNYDARGNQTSVTDPRGNTTLYAYDPNGNLDHVTDALGQVTRYTYDAMANRLTETDPLGSTRSYTYDPMGRLLSATDPMGRTTAYSYDGNGNRISETDALGHTTQLIYDAYNRLSETVDPAGNRRTLRYDHEDHVVSVTEPDGSLTFNRYDVLGRLTTEIRKVGDTDPTADSDDVVTQYTYDAAGNMLSMTDPQGKTVSYEYDGLGRKTCETNAKGERIMLSYDVLGQLTAYALPNGNVIQATYDRLGRQLTVTDAKGLVASYTYDGLGNRTSVTDALGVPSGFAYDRLGRQTRTTSPDGRIKTYSYDAVGRVVSVQESGVGTISYGYDANGRKTSITDPLGNVMRATYDGDGNLLTLTDSNGNVTEFAYDRMNRVIRKRYADGTERQFVYDAMGRVTQETSPSGDTVTTTYDDLGRVVKEDYPGGNDNTFSYDRSGNLLAAVNAVAAVHYVYDDAGTPVKSILNGVEVSYAYDLTGNQRTITYPNGRAITETYNERAELVQISDDAGNTLVGFAYDAANRPMSRVLQNGYDTAYTYSPDGTPASLSHRLPGKKEFVFQYGLDGQGNRTACTKAHDSAGAEQYGYDALSRLVTFRRGMMAEGGQIAEPGHQVSYVYDGPGNRVARTSDGLADNLSYNRVNACTRVNGTDLLHDQGGNLTDDGNLTYTYDPADRLIKVSRKSDQAVLASYEYDAFGRRTAKIVSGMRTEYFYDGPRVIATRTGPQIDRTYVYGTFVDDVAMMEVGGNRYFYLADGTYNTVALTDVQGNVVEEYSYEPYGAVVVRDPAGNPMAVSSVDNPCFFTGREWDKETGLYYFRARYYSPELGRFLTRDPMGGPFEAANPYVYSLDNPINRLDPYGLVSTSSSKCSSKKTQVDYKRLFDWLPSTMRKKVPSKGTISYEVRRCDKCCTSGPNQGRLLYDESDVVNVSPWQWRSGGTPFWGVTIPMTETYLGLVGYLTVGLGGNARADIDGCTMNWTGGGCINGAVSLDAKFGGEVKEVAGAYVSGAVGLSGQVCLRGSTSGISVRDRWCVSGSLKVLADLYFFTFQWVPVQANYCLSLLN